MQGYKADSAVANTLQVQMLIIHALLNEPSRDVTSELHAHPQTVGSSS